MPVYNLRKRGFEIQLATMAATVLASALASGPSFAQTARNVATISTPDGSDYVLTNNSAVDEDEVIRLLTAKAGQTVSGPDASGIFTASYTITVQNTATSGAAYGNLIDTLDFPSNIEVIGASWTCAPTSASCAGSSATGAGPYTLAASNTAIAASTTHTYTISIRFRYKDTVLPAGCGAGDGLSNSIALPAGQALNSTSNSACLPPPPIPAPSLSLIKTAGTPSGNVMGSQISYSFALLNDGDVTLSNLLVTDPLLDAPATCAVLTLLPGESTTCTGLRTLTQADIDAGHFDNSATATGKPPVGGDFTTPPSTTTTPLLANPVLDLVKTAGVPSGNTVGSTIQYSFALTNSGNVTLTGLVVNDALLDAAATCTVVTLLPGESTTCTGLRTLTQADFDAASADNSATATGNTPTGGSTTSTPSTTTTPLVQNPGLNLVKTAGVPSGNTIGSTIEYSFAVLNTGNITLNSLVINDPLLDGPATCALVTLIPGESTTCTGLRTLTQTDFDAGKADNSATVTGTPPTGSPLTSPPSTTSTPLPPNPVLDLIKTAGVPSGDVAGATITYSFALTNSGNVTLSGLLVNDALLDAPATCAVLTLLPGESTTCTGLRTLTQADFNTGKADNTATVTGTPPSGPPISSPPSSTSTPLPPNPVLDLIKTAGVPSGDVAGATITYSFALTNSGNVTLSGLLVNDALLDAPATCAVVTLLPGESTTCTGLRTLTQADFNTGKADNTASVTGTTPGGTPVVSPPSTTTTPLIQTTDLNLVKTAGSPSGNTVGSTIEFTFALSNTGNVTLDNLLVNDALLDAPATCAVVTLLPGESTTCTGMRTLTQADFDAAVFNNTATVTGTPPGGTPVTSPPSTTKTPLIQTPALDLIKTAGTPSGNTVGSTIEYSFALTNSGNVTLSGLLVNDALLDAPATCAVVTLLPGESTTCTGLRTLTQADFNAGKADNTATVTGSTPGGDPITSPPSTTTTPLTKTPALDLIKSAGVPSGNTVGSTIEFTFALSNIGNVTLDNLLVNDALLDAPATCAVVTLLPGESTTCTGLRTLTQADINAAVFNNTATATGTPPGGTPVTSPPSTTKTPLIQTPALDLVKTAGTPSGNTVGSTIEYSFALTNSGNITLSDLLVNDALLDAPATCAVVTLLPGESTTCTGLRTLTQADFNLGTADNTATATGTTPSGDPTTSTPSTTTTPLIQTPALDLIKSAGAPSGHTAGSTIQYSFALTNSGNVSLSGLQVNDALLDAPATCAVVTLLPGESTTCTGLRTLTQADFNLGTADNTATAIGDTPTGGSTTSTPSSTTTPLIQSPALGLVKTAGTPSGNTVGSTIEYSFALTNSGNVSLSGLIVEDALLDAPAICAVVNLLPGESTTCTGLRTLTQADFDLGTADNTATAIGDTPSGGSTVSTPSSTKTPLIQIPALDLVKTAGTPSGNTVGSTIEYSFALTNTGNVSLSGLLVNDALLDAPATCAVVTLLPGESTTCTGLRTLTQADFNSGSTINTATATGTPPSGDPIVSPPSTTTTIHVLTPELTIDKVPLQPSYSFPGEVVDFEFRVTNTGNVTITDLIVVDGKILNITCPETTLEPGQTVVCTASYVVTQDDIETGEIGGTATADGTPSAGTMDPAEDTEVIEAVITPSLLIEKTATLTLDGLTIGMADVGDEITYAVVVTNTGNVFMNDLKVNDIYQAGEPRLLNCVPQILAPGERSVCDTYVHLVTRQEASQGGLLENIAKVEGTPSRGMGPDLPGTPVTESSTSTDKTLVPLADPSTTLRVIKSAAPRDVRVGDIVRYSVVIENLGQTHASDVILYDMPPAGFTLIENSLTVADRDNKGRLVGTRPFRVDQIDVDAGERATVTYLLRVGAGVRPGVHVNEAHSQEGENLSNTATAEVRLVGDPLMDESLIVGTVFDDRDADGWQDTAHLDDIKISGGLDAAVITGQANVTRDGQAYGQASLSQGVSLGHIAARQSIADIAPQVTISQTVSEPRFDDSFTLTSRQGLTLNMAADGTVTRSLSGDAKRGLTSADPSIERRVSATDGGYRVDYIITNNGIDERGIAGVRIASVEGLLIETDPYGRYHLIGVEGGPWERGRNFILSVDPTSLPKGAVFTTDNPNLRRITPGVPVRFDFGVQLPVEVIGGGIEEVVMKLAEVVFTPGSAEVRELYGNVLDHMAGEIKTRGAGDIIITANGETRDLAYARAVAVRTAMATRLSAEELSKLSVTVQTDREDTQNWVAKITDAPVLGQVLFDTDKWEVKPEFAPLLDQVARTLEAAHAEAGSEMVIRLVGHTDLRASDAYNLRLGLRRSQAVFEALASRLSPEFRSKLRVEITNEVPATAVTAGR